MRAMVIYRIDSEFATQVESFLRDFSRQTGKEVDQMDPDTKAGIDFCQAYDIVEYPTIVALSDDGHLQNSWQGMPLPTISEVSYYA